MTWLIENNNVDPLQQSTSSDQPLISFDDDNVDSSSVDWPNNTTLPPRLEEQVEFFFRFFFIFRFVKKLFEFYFLIIISLYRTLGQCLELIALDLPAFFVQPTLIRTDL